MNPERLVHIITDTGGEEDLIIPDGMNPATAHALIEKTCAENPRVANAQAFAKLLHAKGFTDFYAEDIPTFNLTGKEWS